jgi:site-specific DNA recombinase
MHNPYRMICAVYARYSSDTQRDVSLDDQVRKVQEFAVSEKATVLADWIIYDRALSGTGSDRPGFQRLMKAALSPQPPFNTILTSRLPRNLGEEIRLQEQLRFCCSLSKY